MNIVTLNDKNYPKLLKKIGKDVPKQLYYKGAWDKEIFDSCLAVVGSRRMTTYGKQVVERIVGEAAAAGLTIVSGFMYGIDATAHKTALGVGGRTIAVMPCGIDLIHPEYQQDLYVEILNNKGLVISEYEGVMQPSSWTYPRRNRIVAGLSKAALIVEAGEKSGSLITANWAKKFKRKVFVVPGPITSENSKGIMQLIKEGAEPISSANDILKYYKIKSQIINYKFQINPKSQIPAFAKASTSAFRASADRLAGKQNSKTTMTIEQKIFEQLEREPLGADELARTFSMPASKLGVILSMMQLKGFIKQEGGKYNVN